MANQSGPDVLRADLRELRAERTRVGWWRRLVRARLDLAVARTAQPQPLRGRVLDAMTSAGVPVPDDEELAQVLAGGSAAAEVSRLVALRDLDDRLGAYERRIDAALRDLHDGLLERLAADPAAMVPRAPGQSIDATGLPTGFLPT